MPGGLALASIEVVTFDVYGTLVDWEAGILAAMHPVLQEEGITADADAILAAFGRAESAAESGPYVPYREILRRTFSGMGRDLGFACRPEIADTLVDSMPRWPMFADARGALAELSLGRALGVISNVDDDLFAPTRTALGTRLDLVVTAAQVRVYKPAHAPFLRMRAQIEARGLSPSRWLHVAQSRFHDVAPARALGVACAHVRRDAGRLSHATPDADATADLEVADLRALVQTLREAAA